MTKRLLANGCFGVQKPFSLLVCFRILAIQVELLKTPFYREVCRGQQVMRGVFRLNMMIH
ncbi:MAG: hypothetical protein CM15mP83_9450 [Flavobacteriaceae bacterium]|nr:MAG: hypothetical protein CM15mP83_9450 [Flavobacteriaceae bacterium]